MSAGCIYNDLLFRQLFDKESSTYSYLLADRGSKEAVIIDPVLAQTNINLRLIKGLGLKLVYAINTRLYANNIMGAERLKSFITETKSIISEKAGYAADIYIKDGDEIFFGMQRLEVRGTPGHTDGCVTYVDHRHAMAFTGGTLLSSISSSTDGLEGCPEKLYVSLHSRILTLPDNFRLYPTHDLSGHNFTSVAEEKFLNPRLNKSKEEFIEMMNNNKNASHYTKELSMP